MEQQFNPITEGSIVRPILNFFFPILVGTFFQQLYNTADAIIVGRFLGKQALAATGGTTTVIINLVVFFFINMASGASVVISQYYGARTYKEVTVAVHTAIALAIWGGILIMILGIAIMPALLSAVHSPADVYPLALLYLRIYFLGMIGNLIYNIGSSVLRAVGDSRRPLYFLIVSCFVNIVLDILLVAVIPLGIAGAAIATILAQLISAILVMVVLFRTHEVYRVDPRKIRLDIPMTKKIFAIGLPAGIQGSTFSISNLFIQSVLNGFGTDIVAAWSAFTKIDAFFWMINNALSVAATTFSGQNFGADRMDRVKKGAGTCLGMYMLFAAAASCAIYFFGLPLLKLFTTDESVLSIGRSIQIVISPFYFLYAFTCIYSATIRGTGQTMVPMMINILGICGTRILWVFFIVPLNPVLNTVTISYPLTWLLVSVMFTVYYFFGSWRKARF